LECNGASVNAQGGFDKWTPLFYASLCGQYQCVEFLLTIGANMEICDARGMNCIDLVENEIKALESILKPSAEKIDATNLQSSVGLCLFSQL